MWLCNVGYQARYRGIALSRNSLLNLKAPEIPDLEVPA